MVLGDEALDDPDRIVGHLRDHDIVDASLRGQEILSAIAVLEGHPKIGRPTASGLRELVIGSGSHGYIALYRYVIEMNAVLVLAIRAQREAGYLHV
ncbi:MAG: type II toxin-antitoxin system RelE/ParE family toxin [Lysobacterales bacterium]